LKPKAKYIFLDFVLLTVFLMVFTGCYKKDFSELKLANASPEYLYPLIDAELSLKDIIDPSKKKLNILEDADGFYTFVYYQDLVDQYITDLLKIKDISLSQSAALTSTEVSGLPVSKNISHNFSNSFTLVASNAEQLKHVQIKSGSIPFNVSSTFKHNVQLTVAFPYIKKNNVAVTKTVSLNYTGGSTVNVVDSIDLSGCTIDLSENGTKVNTISYDAVLKVAYITGNSITAAQKITFSTGIKNIAYSYADGYIGKYSVTIPYDSVAIDIFSNAYAGNVFFTDPKVRALISNSIGAESTVKINQLVSSSNITGTTVITGSQINTSIPVLYPSQAELGQIKTTTIQLDKTNSNVQTVFNPAPDKIFYQMSAILNPSGVASNYVTDQSKLSIRGEVEIPMEGKVTKFVLLDTIPDLTFPSGDITGNGNDVTVISAAFNIGMVNGFPLNSNVQMYFIDDQNNIIDSLFSTPHLIPAASVDGDGKVISSNSVLIKEVFDEQRYRRVTSAKKAVLYAFFNTAMNGAVPVKIYSSYKIKSNISIDVKANVSF
jgi:hypothetical protein